jgi:hypothetical protein
VANHDEITHTLIARWSWHHPSMILDQWGRVGHTTLYLIPSLGGLTGARIMSLLVSCGTVVLATLLARSFGVRHLWLVPLLLWFQPWFNDLGYTAMTEVPFTLGLTAAVLLCVRRQWSAAALVVGTLPLVRNEGIIYAALLGIVLLAGRRRRQLALLVLPTVVYNLLYLAVHQELGSGNFAHADGGSLYGRGGWFHYLPGVWHGVGPVVFVLAAAGTVVAVRRGRAALWLLAFPLWFVVHTVIYHLGLYASGGYTLFLLPLAPGAAVVAAIGVDGFVRGTRRLALPAFMLPVLAAAVAVAVALFGLQTTPRKLDPDGVAMKDVAGWVDQHTGTRPAITTHPWFAYFHDYGRQQLATRVVDAAAVSDGTILVWDRHYSPRYGLSFAALTAAGSGWVLLYRDSDLGAVFERTG